MQPSILTFLIADVRGYTRFTQERGDEAAARLASRLADLCERVVEAHGGTLLELRGDETLCVFASSRNALRAALGLQAACRTATEEDPSLPLRVGIGLDAGEAIPVKSGYRGGALNLAARLCSLAGPGEILASDAVTHLARRIEGVQYTDRGRVELKGLDAPVQVMKIVEEHDEESPESTASSEAGAAQMPVQNLPIGGFLGALPANTLVARERELSRVRAAIDAVAGGEGRLVVLAGEPGAGKTRLAQEATLYLRDRGFVVAAGRCFEPEQALPYYPFLDVLDTVFSLAPPALQQEAARRWPYLGVLLPDQIGVPPNGRGSGQEEAQRVPRDVTSFLGATSMLQPLAILLDDLHWSDTASLRLLHHLAEHTRTMPIFLLGTYRDVELGRHHDLEGALRDVQREGLADRIDVRRLDVDGTAALVSAAFGDQETSRQFVDLVHSRTEGNPYFVQQVLEVLVERGDVFQKDGVWDRRAIEDIDVPASIRSVVGQRLSHLARTTQDVLAEASVLGQTLLFDDLLAISEAPERQIEAALEEACRAGLLRELGRDTYGFDHALTQQSIYQEQPSRRKRRLHLAAGEALDRLPEAQRASRVVEIAWHFLEADDVERAVRYSILAGEQAEAVFAHREAELRFRAAAQLAREDGDAASEAVALEKLGTALEMQALPDQSLEALEGAAAIYRAMGDLRGEARVTAGIGSALMHLGKPDEAIGRLRSTLAALESHEPSAALAKMSFQLSAILYGAGQYDACLLLAEQARDVAKAIGDAGVVAGVENYRGDVLMQMGKIEDARQVFADVMPASETTGDLRTIAHTVQDLAATHMLSGQFAQSEICAERAIELQRRIDAPNMVAFAISMLTAGRFYAGDWEGSDRAGRESVEMIRGLPPSWQAAFVYGYAGMVPTLQGRWDDAGEYLHQAVALGTDNRVALPLAQQYLAERDLFAGDFTAARSRLEPLASDRNLWATMMLPTLAWAQVESGDIAAADATLELVTDLAQQYLLARSEGLRVLGIVRRRQGRTGEALQAFEEALSLARSMPYPHLEARTLRDLAWLYVDLDQPLEARRHLQAAAQIFQRLGAAPDLQRTDEALQTVG